MILGRFYLNPSQTAAHFAEPVATAPAQEAPLTANIDLDFASPYFGKNAVAKASKGRREGMANGP